MTEIEQTHWQKLLFLHLLYHLSSLTFGSDNYFVLGYVIPAGIFKHNHSTFPSKSSKKRSVFDINKILYTIFAPPILSRRAHARTMAHVFYNMNYLALIITLVLAFVYLLLGGEVKKEPKGSSSFLHHDYFGLKSLVRKC